MSPLPVHRHLELIKPHSQLREGGEGEEINQAERGRDIIEKTGDIFKHYRNLLSKHWTEPQLHVVFLAEHEYEACGLYLAEFQSRAVLPFHLPTVIFGMSYQTPVKCIVCPCKDERRLNVTNLHMR